ncbi:hypothetical protein FCULG_00012182 [Fusarium culmorum]|uniref:DUF7580 domain-containing protein n=1 Tax=Fusarium culmorum TaxID=5516 RepID=A0A2T4GFB1_FUSCU|nr:hypothetical protein FCULG_00012182 [Fusarium culmorum]
MVTAYSDGVQTIFNIVIRSRWEERLESFYLDFYIQLFYVEEVMQRVLNVISASANTIQLISNWYNDPKFEIALKGYFRSDERFRIFTVICKKVLMLLSHLVKDETNRICQKDQVSSLLMYKSQVMFEKLKMFANARESRATESTFADRFSFFKHEKKRTECLRRLKDQNNLKTLDTLCDAFSPDLDGFSIAFILEASQGHDLMRRFQCKPRRLRFFELLALIFAESLLLYHGSDWLQPGWVKDDIYFFFKTEDEPDLKTPLLSARLNVPGSGQFLAGSMAYHANPSILALGVLLIEIFNERAIEKWKTAKERSNSNTATLQIVADRIVNKMDSSGSTKAIQACLSLDWIPVGRSAGLDDADTRTGFLKNVIWPIKQELQCLSANKIF